jgi:CRP-like cAMP-binding protein
MSNAPPALIRFLQSSGHITAASAEHIASRFTQVSYPKGAFFLREGRVSNEYLFLEQGYLRAFAYDTEGADTSTAFYGPGQVVFEVSSFFTRTQAKENIQTLTDCSGWAVSYDGLNALFHGLPEFREFGRHILVTGFAALKSRMLAMITETAEERYASLLMHNPELLQHAALKHIATYLGITDTSLSRIRKDLSKKQTA